MARQSLPRVCDAGAAGHPSAGAAGHPSAGAAGHVPDAGAAGHARPVLALYWLASDAAPPAPMPSQRQILPPHPPPTLVCAMARHAPPRTLFLTRSTHFVKPHTQSTPLPKQNAPPSHYYKNL